MSSWRGYARRDWCMMPTDRDPRANPKPGDVLTKGTRTRTVTEAGLYYPGDSTPSVCWVTPTGSRSWSWLKVFRRWAKGATVERVGDTP